MGTGIVSRFMRFRRTIKYRFLLNRYREYKREIGLDDKKYDLEYQKYKKYYVAGARLDALTAQIDEFFTRKLDRLDQVADFDEKLPTVVCVVKNEKSRMKLFFDHYRGLGVRQFAILDNYSDDGTLEFLLEQPDTHVYSVKEKFQTQKKESWIEKLLAVEGYDRWYIVVDSDELLDYVESETHDINDFIATLEEGGHKRTWGMMLDMYSQGELFALDCEPQDIPTKMCYFDCDSYMVNHRSDELGLDALTGGPRHRVFGTDGIQSKQSVFYFTADTFYANCHFLYPNISWEDAPFCFVLRHYKFLKSDEATYKKRIEEKNFFGGSMEYVSQMDAIKEGVNSMYYEGSVKYEDSSSLRKIPYLVDMFSHN